MMRLFIELDENQFTLKKQSELQRFCLYCEYGDKIFVYENTNYNKSYTFSVEGEVIRPKISV